ncbi:MAG: hypothetical protein ACR2IF_07110 [Terriglobales bacterium]
MISLCAEQNSPEAPQGLNDSLYEIRELWRKSPSADMIPRGEWCDEIQYYFNRSIFHVGIRLDIVAKLAESLPPERAAKCACEYSDIRKELAVCNAVAGALLKLVRQTPIVKDR